MKTIMEFENKCVVNEAAKEIGVVEIWLYVKKSRLRRS